MKVIKNTYPARIGIAHAETDDIVHWELIRGCYWLIRDSDHKTLFGTAPVDKNGALRSNGQPPALIGTVAEVKSKGWRLILSK